MEVEVHSRDGCTELVSFRDDGVSRSNVVAIDRSTRFGNPFRMQKDGGNYTRKGCVQAYAAHFASKIQSSSTFRQQVEDLRGERLGCWCVPKLCHGHVLLWYLNGELNVEKWASYDPEEFTV